MGGEVHRCGGLRRIGKCLLKEARVREVVTTALDVVAAGLIIAGVYLVFPPLALIVAGLLLGLISWRQS